jgi:hypothetical protein
LCRLPADDSLTVKGGFELRLDYVDDWAKHPQLRHVRKYRLGRHRAYIKGRHTECNYVLVWLLQFKDDRTDRPGAKSFQNIILRALEGEPDKILWH